MGTRWYGRMTSWPATNITEATRSCAKCTASISNGAQSVVDRCEVVTFLSSCFSYTFSSNSFSFLSLPLSLFLSISLFFSPRSLYISSPASMNRSRENRTVVVRRMAAPVISCRWNERSPRVNWVRPSVRLKEISRWKFETGFDCGATTIHLAELEEGEYWLARF